MMTKPLLPQVFGFAWPRLSARGNDPAAEPIPCGCSICRTRCALPDWGQLDGLASWAQVRVALEPAGLGITVLADGLSDQQLARDRPEGFALAQFWIDTRDTRNVSRATRFCHRFMARLEMAKAGRQLTVDVSQRPCHAPRQMRHSVDPRP